VRIDDSLESGGELVLGGLVADAEVDRDVAAGRNVAADAELVGDGVLAGEREPLERGLGVDQPLLVLARGGGVTLGNAALGLGARQLGCEANRNVDQI